MRAEGRRNLVRIIESPAFFLCILTAFAAVLRLTYLPRPPIWGDEAKTFMRACGSFQQLVDTLATSDFAPLHYLLYWAIAQLTPLTPTIMRSAPAIAGTFMVPAMYWLAVQLIPRRTAMLVALFTACSAFMLNYSRDAKMYAECWLFVTLSTASLLWLIRSRSRIAWYLWVVFSIAMIGLQAVATIVLVIQTIVFLSHPNLHWKSAIFFILGIAITLTPLIAYFQYFNRYAERAEDGRVSSGTGWVEPYNKGRDGLDLARYAATAYLYNWEWPRAVDEPQIRERTLKLLKGAGIALGVLLLLGVFPWRNFSRLRHRDGHVETVPAPDSAPAPLVPMAPIAWWRSLLWISAWLVLPAYGFYCASLKIHQSPIQMLRSIWDWMPEHAFWIGLMVLAVAASFFLCDVTMKSRVRKLAFFLAIFCILVGLCALINLYTPVQPGSVWIPRYLGIIWPAFAIAVCVLLLRLPTIPLRAVAISLLLLVNLVQHGARVFAASEPPTDLMAQDILRSRPKDSDTRTYNQLQYSNIGEPGSGVIGTYPARYYLSILAGKPITAAEMRSPGSPWEQDFRIFTLLTMNSDQTIASNVSASPQLKRIIVWDKLLPGQIDQFDKLAEKLPPEWKRTSEEFFPAKDHWTWRDLFTARRREYERK
jgi:4-amino-4-deoxy-L-arabinose transferase-like glycosyltransferase